MVTMIKGDKSLTVSKSQVELFQTCGWVPQMGAPISSSENNLEETNTSPFENNPEELPLDSMSLKGLKTLGESLGLDLSEVASKKQAIELIQSVK